MQCFMFVRCFSPLRIFFFVKFALFNDFSSMTVEKIVACSSSERYQAFESGFS